MSIPEPFRELPDGLEVYLRVSPRASANRIVGVQYMGDSGCRLKVMVTAVPEDGKANKAVIKVLAKAWKLAKSMIEVTSGATDRNKTVFITGDATELAHLITRTTTDIHRRD